MCLYTRIIKNPHYLPNKKNGGKPPPVDDERKLYVPASCGICIECRKAKSREWMIRLVNEDMKGAKFITLTINEENYDEKRVTNNEDANEYCTELIRRFLERWRKKHKHSVKHWLIPERGHNGTQRLHFHGIIWTNDDIEERWQLGWVYIGEYVNARTVGYITKYITKYDERHPDWQPRVYSSPGLGKTYAERQKKYHRYEQGRTNTNYTTPGGKKVQIPEYLRKKIWTEDERAKIWTETLDKGERWVGGEKIEINSREKEVQYVKAIEYRRRRAQELGGQAPEYTKIEVLLTNAEIKKQKKL